MIRSGIVARTGKSGGAEDYIVRLYDSLERHGVDSLLFGEIDGWADSGRMSVNLDLTDKWSRSNFPKGLMSLAHERRILNEAVRNNPVDIYHLHFKREQIGFTDILHQYGPVLWTEHGRFGRGPYSQVIARLYARAAKKVDAIACVSEYVAADVREITGLPSKVVVVPNSVDTQKFRLPTAAERRSAREKLQLDEHALVFAFVGRLESNKRPMLAVELALSMDAVLLVAGTGSLENQVSEADKGESIRSLGQLPDTRDVYWAADVHLFLSSGAGEGFPTVLVEAAACGLPTLAIQGNGFESEVSAIGVVSEDSTLGQLRTGACKLIEDRVAHSIQAREWSSSYDIVPWAKRHLELVDHLRQGWGVQK